MLSPPRQLRRLLLPPVIRCFSFVLLVLTTLNFLSTGSYQRTVGNSAWTTMSQTSVCRAIGNVCQLLTDVMMPQTVRFPTTLANKNSTKQGFYEKTGFRGVIGCIDGTHVEIVAPPSTDEDHPPHLYINRKGVHSINVMLLINVVDGAGGDLWPLDRPDGMPSIQSLEVMCGKDHMDVHLTFSQPFEGIVSSKGQHGDPRCVYVPPSTGQTFFSFRIAYARCGTKPDLHGQFYENTVVVQYDKDLLEVWDEAKRLRCEWFNDYEKTASKPPMVIADLDVIQLDFRGDNVDCWMEIQHGKGPWAPPVSGIVPLGSTLTLVVAINDYRGEFDMRVKSCVASDGGGHVIQLSDEFGCVLRPKMISRFLKARGADERASVITYAFFHAFKFPDALSVHIKCKVEICRHGCLDHCQIQPDKGDVNPELYLGPLERKDDKGISEEERPPPAVPQHHPDPLPQSSHEGNDHYESAQLSLDAKLSNQRPQIFESSSSTDMDSAEHQEEDLQNQDQDQHIDRDRTSSAVDDDDGDNDKELLEVTAVPHKDMYLLPHELFPHGPRTFDDRPVAAPRAFSTAGETTTFPKDTPEQEETPSQHLPLVERMRRRRRRSVFIADRKARSADVGVSGLYEVISEADLAFSPDSRAEAVTVFQGRIREEVVYGICMPVPGFSLLFVLVAVSAVVSALVAGSLLYRYQLQKEHLAQQQAQRNGPAAVPMSLFPSWMGLRLLKVRPPQRTTEMNGSAPTGEATVVPSTSLNGKTEDSSRGVHE